MQKIIVLIGGIFIVVLVYFSLFSKNEIKIVSPTSQTSITSVPTKPKEMKSSISPKPTTSLFVPYWSFGTRKIDGKGYDRLLYFGISVNEEGIDTEDAGYQKLNLFLKLTDANKEQFLVIRMINSATNSKVLSNRELQAKIITESVELAKANGFNGIVLDFEMSALAFESVVKSITEFYQLFYNEVKDNDLQFLITLFGDTFYLARPYDVTSISNNSDEVLIMAYDFHKARGNPGPNFPLNGRKKYGYDFAQMILDFSKAVPQEKLAIVFGLFGYDWMVNDKNEASQSATPLSFFQIKDRFLDSCSFVECSFNRDLESAETEVRYKDFDGVQHSVWFEDMESLEKKKMFLKGKGIESIGFWTYSYF